MWISPKTEICHLFIFIFIIFFHSLQKQNLGRKSSWACQVDKWSCLKVIIDFVFERQQPCFFLYRRYSMRLNNQYSGVRYQVLLVVWWDRNEQGLLNEFLQLSLRYFQLYFRTGTALASLLLLALADAISYKKPYNIALHIYFLPNHY